MNFLVLLYRKFVSESLRDKIYNLFLGKVLNFFRSFQPWLKSKMIYLFPCVCRDKNRRAAYIFMGKYGITNYPFSSSLLYKSLSPEVFINEENKLKYIKHNGKDLYFPSFFSNDNICSLYRDLVIEQDVNSPHRYVNSYGQLRGKILLDVGAAEGIFALDTIDFTEKVYLFECEDFWIDALRATFAPWKDKVQVVNKYVSDKNSDFCITLDSFLKDKMEASYFLKMDIEGAELSALRGVHSLSKNVQIAMAICTYHRQTDEEDIECLLRNLGYSTYFTEGYLFWNNSLRKAVIRASK